MVESAVSNVKPSPSAPSGSVVPLLQKVRQSAGFMGEHQQALKPNRVDSAVPRLNEFMAKKRAKRELIGLQLCVGLGR